MYQDITDGKYDSKLDYSKDRKKYRKDQLRLNEQFKKDALEHVGLSEHPKANKIYAYAWERGHSSGFYEVLYYLEDLAELFYD